MTVNVPRLDSLGVAGVARLPRRRRSPFTPQLAAAVDFAYGRFAVRYMRWADSLFDRHFLYHHAAGTLIAFADGRIDRQQAAEELAADWERQHGDTCADKRRCQTELNQATSVFMSWVAEALNRHKRAQPSLGRRLTTLLTIAWPHDTP